LGYNPIYLAGVDYGGPRFNRYDWHYDTKTWTLDADTSGFDAAKSSQTFQGLSASKVMSYSSRGALISAFLQIANEKYQQRIYQLSDRTILNQFPFRKWEDVLSGKTEVEEYDRKTILEEIEMALAVWDTFMVPLQGGWGLDWHTYIADEESNFSRAMENYNNQVKKNLIDFQRIEDQHKRPVEEMMAAGHITIEAGDLLLHGAEEFPDWHWRNIKEIDVPQVLLRRRWLVEEGKKRGYTKGAIHHMDEIGMPGAAPMSADDAKVVELNQGKVAVDRKTEG
jgi:hypothetical protein